MTDEPSSSRAAGRFRMGLILLVCGVCVTGSSGVLQDIEVGISGEHYRFDEQPTAAEDRLRVDISTDLTNAYYFRGLLQERADWIVQPAIELGFTLSDVGDVVQVEVFAGAWSSFHSLPTGAETSDDVMEHWYELDLYPGVSCSHGPWTATATYWYYLSPSDAFDRLEEIEFTLGYDDSALWDDGFALNPWAGIAVEVAGSPASGDDRGVYASVGINPGFDWRITPDTTIALNFPVTAGFSLDDYYQDENGADSAFGYLDTGVEAAMPWPGNEAVQISAGAHWLHLGTNARAVNGGRSDEFVARLGFSVSF